MPNLTPGSKVYPLCLHPDSLLIYCSDPRFQYAVDVLLCDISLLQPAKICVPGGIHDLISPARTKARRVLKDQIEYILMRYRIKHVVIVNHDGCKWYERWGNLSNEDNPSVNHLLKAKRMILGKACVTSVDLFLARIEGENTRFYQVTE